MVQDDARLHKTENTFSWGNSFFFVAEFVAEVTAEKEIRDCR